MFNNLLFDLDGTLTDPKEGICKCVQYALAHYGIEPPEIDELTAFIGPPLVDSFIDFYGFSPEQAYEARLVYHERFKTIGKFENFVYDGIPELLQALTNRGMVLAIASSKPEIMVKEILEHFDLAKYFPVMVGSNMDGSRSAKEEVVEEALNRLQALSPTIKISAQTTAMIGDRKFDIIGAKDQHLFSIGVEYGYAPEGELEQAGADFIAKTVQELQDFLLD